MKSLKIPGTVILLLIIPIFFSCGGGGSDAGPQGPPQGSTDPADIVASIRYMFANVTYSQSASITAKVFDYNGDRVPDGTPVRFTVNENSITSLGNDGEKKQGNNREAYCSATELQHSTHIRLMDSAPQF